MGLELVQVMVELEARLDVQMANGCWPLPTTASDVYELVRAQLYMRGYRKSATDPEAGKYDVGEVWPVVRASIANSVGVPPERVTLTTRLVEDLGFG